MIPLALELEDMPALRECATRLRLIANIHCDGPGDRYYVLEAEQIILGLLSQVDLCMNATGEARPE